MTDDDTECALHVRLHSRCGACGYHFAAGDRIVALLLRGSSYTALDALEFPDTEYAPWQGDIQFCRFNPCPDCEHILETGSLETGTVHVDCFNVARKLSGHRNRLWTTAIRQSPWPGTSLPPILIGLNPAFVIPRAAQITGLSWLTKLPVEIAHMTIELIATHTLARLCAVEELVKSWDDTTARPHLDGLPLRRVRAWRRGEHPVFTNDTTEVLMRVTVDARGIWEISRASEKQNRFNPLFCRYALINSAGCTIDFKHGLARLTPPRKEEWLFWDMDVLPDITSQCLLRGDGRKRSHTTSLSFSSSWGITIFMLNGITVGVHAHTDQSLSAELTFRTLPVHADIEDDLVWVFVPFSSSDKCRALGVRLRSREVPSVTYIFRTASSGDFTVGPYHHEGEVATSVVTDSSRLTFTTYSDSATLPTSLSPSSKACPDLSPLAPRFRQNSGGACFSSAPLSNVEYLSLYRDQTTESLRGIIVHYKNGSRRALGSCRIGIDPVGKCRAEQLCITLDERGRQPVIRAYVDRARTDPDVYEGLGWVQCRGTGFLEAWVTGRGMLMVYHGQSASE